MLNSGSGSSFKILGPAYSALTSGFKIDDPIDGLTRSYPFWPDFINDSLLLDFLIKLLHN
jgi:hypothetical protein